MRWRTKEEPVSPAEAIQDPVKAYGVVEVRYVASLLRSAPADHQSFHVDPKSDQWWDAAAADLLRAIHERKLYEFSWDERTER